MLKQPLLFFTRITFILASINRPGKTQDSFRHRVLERVSERQDCHRADNSSRASFDCEPMVVNPGTWRSLRGNVNGHIASFNNGTPCPVAYVLWPHEPHEISRCHVPQQCVLASVP
jgi:hypothetical protein